MDCRQPYSRGIRSNGAKVGQLPAVFKIYLGIPCGEPPPDLTVLK